MLLMSWNIAGRVKKCNQQLELIRSRNPDIVALQEVRLNSYRILKPKLAELGLTHVNESVYHAERVNRTYGELIASRYPLEKLPSDEFEILYKERVLSAKLNAPRGLIEIHTVHIPPGSSNGWIKIDTFEGIYKRLANKSTMPRILCGDFNTPQAELEDGTVITWGQVVSKKNEIRMKRNYERWDEGERSILSGLSEYDLPDTFRALNGYDKQEFSWHLWRKGGVIARRRFDHIFASIELNPIACNYLHEFRESGASDHSAIEARFD